MIIHAEDPRDQAAIHALNTAAFDSPAEADLVDVLRRKAPSSISIVAEMNGSIVGHILFTPVQLTGQPHLKIAGLAPMAVAPQHQRKGIGSSLVREGLLKCKQLGYGAVVVLGHPDYYPRFGFSPSTRFGIGCEFEAPEEAFMAIELQAGFLRGASGNIKYHEAFRSA